MVICTVATYPEQIRGFGHVKKRSKSLAIAWREERLGDLATLEQQRQVQAAA
jgi:hypothetical protein